MAMKVTINDKEVMLSEGSSLEDALQQVAMLKPKTATAVNGQLIRANERATYQLKEGDHVVVITAVTGG